MNKLSQHTQIIRELRKHPEGVPNYRFPKMFILSYTKRISELRQEGWNIQISRLFYKDKATSTFIYKLIEEK